LISQFDSSNLNDATVVDKDYTYSQGGMQMTGDIIKGQFCPIDSTSHHKCANMEYLDVKVIDKAEWQESNSGSNGTLGLLYFSWFSPYYAIDLKNLNDWSWSDLAPLPSSSRSPPSISLGYSEA
jgi:hypothetical protein